MRPTSRSAESSGTTWAGLHGRLHRPRPLLASVDRLLLPIIAVQYCRQYTISRAGCQLFFAGIPGIPGIPGTASRSENAVVIFDLAIQNERQANDQRCLNASPHTQKPRRMPGLSSYRSDFHSSFASCMAANSALASARTLRSCLVVSVFSSNLANISGRRSMVRL